MKRPEIVNATQAELDEILALVKTTLSAKQYKLLEGVLGTFVYVMQALQSAKTSSKRFRNMLFDAATESQRNLLPLLDAGGASDVASAPGAKPAQADLDVARAKVAAPGHGRNGAQAYSDSPVVQVELLDLDPGDLCPQCEDGKVYNSPPRTLVKRKGQAPIAATVYELSRLRCRLCDTIFTAVLPAGVFDSKYDPTAARACWRCCATARAWAHRSLQTDRALACRLNSSLEQADPILQAKFQPTTCSSLFLVSRPKRSTTMSPVPGA